MRDVTDMYYAIDRFEDEQAVLQDDSGKSLVVDRVLLPTDAAQGDILKLYDDGHYRHDRAETVARRDRIRRLEQLLRGKGKDA